LLTVLLAAVLAPLNVAAHQNPATSAEIGAKAFLDQVTKVTAIEFAARRITVNAAGPGSTVSGPFGHIKAEQRTAASSAFGLGRIGEPADTAAVVAFLASADAGFLTSQVIYNADGQRGPIRVDRQEPAGDETGHSLR
jgi:NAD(P)-dependent dehydrogenase (short-subunit alcohol dehydrogenase family)